MITLYHAPFTRSHLIRFALEELALPYEVHLLDVTRGEHKSPQYLAVNPLGQLPTLVDAGVVIREAAAIALHLGDLAPERGLSPAVGHPDRPLYYQWIVFSVAAELAALGKIGLHTRFLPESMRAPMIAESGRADWASVAPAMALGLRGRRFLLGDRFSLADVMVGGSLWLANLLDVLTPYPELVAYYAKVSDRPSFRRAFSDSAAP